MKINLSIKHYQILFILGILGIFFYAAGPLIFPKAPLRQPELLPVYTLMLGLGQLLRENKSIVITSEEKKKENDNDDNKDKE